ncbi:hypothetical protein PU629_07890 [Pullulanibacillus sp. KACC 23026]|uniref:hypothetical protein n=1 Tax=Pullulanibacillus sp. KACC 23026 TaxID=3028315 RepID=UPI0023B0DBD1|nr:hypothetical protein [Pullulanibacillus sp. KACC 23026]WEG14269.1 hypothetical protein PU629_07890 [Pullulanibacillus sp. KACC 23026]
MGYLILILLIIGIVALVMSSFRDSSTKRIENQIESTSITLMQELHKVKKKIRVLEEESKIVERDQ